MVWLTKIVCIHSAQHDNLIHVYTVKWLLNQLNIPRASQVVQVAKNLLANAGGIRDVGLVPECEDLLEEEMATHSSIPAGESHGQKSLVGYSP